MSFKFLCEKCGMPVSPSSPISELDGKAVGPCCLKTKSSESEKIEEKEEPKIVDFNSASIFLQNRGFSGLGLTSMTFTWILKHRPVSGLLLAASKSITLNVVKINRGFNDGHPAFITYNNYSDRWEMYLEQDGTFSYFCTGIYNGEFERYYSYYIKD